MINKIINYYTNLDSLNKIIFWGIILVVILILIFTILMINKTKKTKIIKESEIPEKEIVPINNKNILVDEKNNISAKQEIEKISQKEKNEDIKFNVEELVNNYSKAETNNIEQINIKSDEQRDTPKISNQNIYKVEEVKRKPYEKNILREMSLGQTSPIGIVKPITNENKEKEGANELYKSLSNNAENNIRKYDNSYDRTKEIKEYLTEKNDEYRAKNLITKQATSTMNKDNKEKNDNELKKQESMNSYLQKIKVMDEPKKTNNSENKKYLEEVSKKLSSQIEDDIKRTEYEIQQEEDAIISYEELQRKKDTIQIIDEEDAVISIEELMEREKNNNKLYNITNEAENTNFINELKDFRKDL